MQFERVRRVITPLTRFASGGMHANSHTAEEPTELAEAPGERCGMVGVLVGVVVVGGRRTTDCSGTAVLCLSCFRRVLAASLDACPRHCSSGPSSILQRSVFRTHSACVCSGQQSSVPFSLTTPRMGFVRVVPFLLGGSVSLAVELPDVKVI